MIATHSWTEILTQLVIQGKQKMPPLMTEFSTEMAANIATDMVIQTVTRVVIFQP